jgi:hypothetical protein
MKTIIASVLSGLIMMLVTMGFAIYLHGESYLSGYRRGFDDGKSAVIHDIDVYVRQPWKKKNGLWHKATPSPELGEQ